MSPQGSESSSRTNGSAGGAAAKMVGTAVAAGLLGVLGGAVKAMLERREADSPPSDRKPQAKRDAATEAVSSPEGPRDGAEPEPEGEEDVDREAEGPQARAPDVDAQPVADEDGGLSETDAKRIVTTARDRLETLVGSDVERVSGLERADGRWSVYLEVVEVARIPESTDILATYEVVLDDEGDLMGVSRVRRYRRSQVEEEA